MKKVKMGLALLLASVFVLLTLSSCGAKKRDYVLPRTLVITDKTEIGGDGERITVTITADGGTFVMKQDDEDYWDEDTYDEDGNQTAHRYYEFNELRMEITYQYDKTGRKTSWERYDLYEGRSNGKYSYDEAGKVTEEVSYGEDGERRWSYKYEYDENGNKKRLTAYDAKGKITSEWIYECDAEGRVLKTWLDEAYGGNYCYSAYTYDASGNVLTDARYNTDGSLFRQEAYTYDERGRETEKMVTYGDNGEVFERITTVYEADGSRTVRRCGRDGTEGLTIYRYGQGEKVTKKGTYDGHGVLGWWFLYEYDEHGLPAKRTGHLGASEDVLLCSEVTEYQTVSLTEAQYEAFLALFEEHCGSYFS